MATYDEKLLAAAPEVTKADLQDGYNPDLLREAAVKRSASARVAPTPPRSNSDPHQQPLRDLESSATPLQLGHKKKPFWRTKKGMAVLGLALIAIILAAALGGALGSKKKGKGASNTNTNSNGQSGAGGSGNEGGQVTSSAPAAPSASATGDPGNGAGTGAPPPTASGPVPSPNLTVRPTPTPTQETGGGPSNVIGNGNAGTTAPSTGTTGAGGGQGNGSTGGVAFGVVQPPPNSNTGPTNGQPRDASVEGEENAAGKGS